MAVTYAMIDGVPTEPAAASVPIVDRGFLYGDSVFETMRTAGGRPVDGAWHLERLVAAMNRLGFTGPALATLRGDVEVLLATLPGDRDWALRLVVTRGDGVGPGERPSSAPRRLLTASPLGPAPAVLRVATVRAARTLPEVKSGNYLASVLALHEARAAGADDAIFVDELGEVREGATSNVFVVWGGRLRTPPVPAGLLPGVTRRRVLALAGERAEEGVIWLEMLREADEVFLSSSGRGLVPVVELDGRPVGRGEVGPTTRSLVGAWAAFVAEVAAGRAPGL